MKTEEQPRKSAEEIENLIISYSEGATDNVADGVRYKLLAGKIMESYASQSLPSDEEIEDILDAKKPYKTERYEGEKYDSETYFVLSDEEKYSIKLFVQWMRDKVTK